MDRKQKLKEDLKFASQCVYYKLLGKVSRRYKNEYGKFLVRTLLQDDGANQMCGKVGGNRS